MSVSARCLLWGHDDLVRRTVHRMFLECAECGRQTSGWEVRVLATAPSSRDAEVLDIVEHLSGVAQVDAPSVVRSLGKAA